MASRANPDSAAAPFSARGLVPQVAERLPSLDPADPNYVGDVISAILKVACEVRSSDVHFTPNETELNVSWRIDGVLQPVAVIPRRLAPNVAARLKVLADLLTYRTDVPQEGRLRDCEPDVEMRLSTFPTLYGEKAVVRLFAGSGRYQWPADLGLPDDLQQRLLNLLLETAGALVITGPAGSGKTTTAYACLRELQRQVGAGKSVVTLEDPIETVLSGVSQSQVNRAAGFDYALGLRSLLRQDPDAILVGEVRDRETAETVFQACLTGHLVLTTFHAGSAAEAVSRLGDMGVEPYLLRAGLLGIVCQRLFRALCDCARWTDDEACRLGYPVSQVRVPAGCVNCNGTGYRGRLLLAELLIPNDPTVGRAILDRVDATQLQALAVNSGMNSISRRVQDAVESGKTSPAEARRVLGFRDVIQSPGESHPPAS
ncbi:MAG: type II/IV secretion system protein [Planctomycetes bacterium]|nr:type II/IV secretion system protein [Planctomycetota bacterium]